MTWDAEIAELRRREALAEGMGGEDRVARQRAFGKLTVRERVEALADPGSLHEVGKIAGVSDYDDQGRQTAFRPANRVFARAPPTPSIRKARVYQNLATLRGAMT